MGKENKGVKHNLCLLRNVFVDCQAESKVFSVLVCLFERRGKKWVPVEMVLSPRRKSYHLPVSEEGHRGQSEEGDCLSLFYLSLFGGSVR